MSRSNANFYFRDGVVLSGIYNGTTDFLMPTMHVSSKLAWDAWNNGAGFPDDHYPSVDQCEDCVVYSDYGSGRYWIAKASREKMVCIGPHFWGISDHTDEVVEDYDTKEDAFKYLGWELLE